MDAVDNLGHEKREDLPFLDETHIKADLLRVFMHDSTSQFIKTVTHEFSAVCPFSGLPDLATVVIEYEPYMGLAVELKSLKYYMLSYRNVGIYQEGVTRKIYEHFRDAICPNDTTWRLLGEENFPLRVTTHYHVRGGFYTTCVEGRKSWTNVPGINYPENF